MVAVAGRSLLQSLPPIISSEDETDSNKNRNGSNDPSDLTSTDTVEAELIHDPTLSPSSSFKDTPAVVPETDIATEKTEDRETEALFKKPPPPLFFLLFLLEYIIYPLLLRLLLRHLLYCSSILFLYHIITSVHY